MRRRAQILGFTDIITLFLVVIVVCIVVVEDDRACSEFLVVAPTLPVSDSWFSVGSDCCQCYC